LLSRSKNIAARAPTSSNCVIDLEGEIDEGLITWFKGPASYTGEDVVEIGIHGSPYMQQRLLKRAHQPERAVRIAG
jgi:tRNA U34 5-carboxymethylaminomethyl modifying GTPase MnmE/TrmE